MPRVARRQTRPDAFHVDAQKTTLPAYQKGRGGTSAHARASRRAQAKSVTSPAQRSPQVRAKPRREGEPAAELLRPVVAAELVGAHGAVELRELAAAFLEEQQVVPVDGLREPENPAQRQLKRGYGREVAPAHDARHTGARVVDHRGQVVGDAAVAAAHDRIAEGRGGILAEVELALLARSHHARLEPDPERLGRGPPAAGRKLAPAAASGVAPRAVARARGASATPAATA
jgi:hypothetical protein